MKTDPKTDDNSKANDSDEEQWEDKLVIDLDANMTEKSSPLTPTAKTDAQQSQPGASPETLTESDNTDKPTPSQKAKVKRGASKNAKTDQGKNNQTNGTTQAKTTKALKSETKTVTTKGRKRKDKTSPKNTEDELKAEQPLSNASTDPYEFQGPEEENISATTYGQKSKDKTDGVNKKDTATEYDHCTTGTAVEPEVLGPCEPGTHVSLDGIVWQETTNGVLVVNVTWRGKTYMGTLLDATKHEWAPPRSCDSPTSDFEGRTPKARGKRTRIPLSDTFKDINERKLRKEMRRQSAQQSGAPPSPSPAKSDTGKRRGRSSECDNSETTSKRGRAASRNSSTAPTSPQLIECPEPNCGKKYKHNNGLRYHLTHAHQDSSSIHASEELSDAEAKAELSPLAKKPRRKTKGDKKGKTTSASPIDDFSRSDESHDEIKDLSKLVNSQNSDSPVTTLVGIEKTEETQQAASHPTSVITATSMSCATAIPVPVATISPQVMKPLPTDMMVSTIGRNIPVAPPKLLPKTSATSMAPISTISAHSNSSLKPIQPKPTILGEVKPNPALTDLRDQKKLKRKRSASKEDLASISEAARGMSAPQSDLQRLGQSVQRIEAEQDRMFSFREHSADGNCMQSPSYSDISDDGNLERGSTKNLPHLLNRMPTAPSPYSGMPPGYGQLPYRVATVSPQKTSPSESMRVVEPSTSKVMNSLRHSPAPKSSIDVAKQREQMEQMQQQQQYMSALWANPSNAEMIQMLMKDSNKHASLSISPKPSSRRSSPKPNNRELDTQTSTERLQLLKENMEVKSQMPSSNDSPRDYSMSSNRSADDHSKFLHQQGPKIREQESRDRKKEISNMNSRLSHLAHGSHQSASGLQREEQRLHSHVNSSSPVPHNFSTLMNSPFIPFGANPMLGVIPSGYPFFHGMLDGKSMPANPFNNKSNQHKIHELEESAKSSKSPRGSSDKDTSSSAHSAATKTQQQQQAYRHNEMFALAMQGQPGMAFNMPPK